MGRHTRAAASSSAPAPTHGARRDHGATRARALAAAAGVMMLLVVAVGGTEGLLVPGGLAATPTVAGPGVGGRSAPAPGASTGVPGAASLDVGAFGPDGCILLPARTPKPLATVVLDAGHGGVDPGAVGTAPDGRRIVEKDLTLAVASAAATQLREGGVDVVLSRLGDGIGSTVSPRDVVNGSLTTTASQENLTARVQCANRSSADVLVALHFNSFADARVRGAETLYEPRRVDSARSRALAQFLQAAVLARLAATGARPPDRGINDDSNGAESGGGHLVLLGPRSPGYIDQPSTMPGALVEPLFLTNPSDLAVASTSGGVSALADAVSAGVRDFLLAPPGR